MRGGAYGFDVELFELDAHVAGDFLELIQLRGADLELDRFFELLAVSFFVFSWIDLFKFCELIAEHAGPNLEFLADALQLLIRLALFLALHLPLQLGTVLSNLLLTWRRSARCRRSPSLERPPFMTPL